MTVRGLLSMAYDLKARELVSGLPGWADGDKFDIEGRVDDAYLPTYRTLNDGQKLDRLRVMLQKLLSDRFALESHYADKEMSVYELRLAYASPKLVPSKAGEAMNMMVGQSQIVATAATLADLVTSLGGMVGRIVLDRTGLSGTYDFTLATELEGHQEGAGEAAAVFTSLKEQLGLKLVPARALVPVLVVKRLEKPTAN